MAQFNRKILKQIYCQRALAGDSVVAKLFEQRLVIGGANNADSVCGIKAKRDIGAPPEIALQRRNPVCDFFVLEHGQGAQVDFVIL